MSRSGRNIAVVILAGGAGRRFRPPLPKQFVSVGGAPVFIHALRACVRALRTRMPVYLLVVPHSYKKKAQGMVKRYLPGLSVQIVVGGERRIDSYFHAIEYLNTHYPLVEVVIAHDGARPLVEPSLVAASCRHFLSGDFDAHLTVSSVRESLFKKDGKGIVCLPREVYCLGQTPYIFKRTLLEDIYTRWSRRSRTLPPETDVFELIQLRGQLSVGYLEARGRNIKLTFPEDIAAIRMILKKHPV